MKAEKQVAEGEKAQKAVEKERDEKTTFIRDLQVCLHFQHSYTCTVIYYASAVQHIYLKFSMCRESMTG